MDKVTELAKMIDHSLLHPTMTDKDLHEGCLRQKTTTWPPFVLNHMP
jgi:deoxyribose-phosphate aldolase